MQKNKETFLRGRTARRLLSICLFATVAQATLLADELHAGDPPVLNSFTATHVGGNWWMFSGTVSDEDPGTAWILFDGLLFGHSTAVQADGSFYYFWEFGSGESGVVDAQANDIESQSSNTLSDLVI